MLKKLELSARDHHVLFEYCRGKKIKFLSTAFDHDSIDLLRELDIELGKIPSGEITNLPYLRKMAKSFKQLILSTGMATMQEVEDAVNVLVSSGAKKENITILHCTTEYPTPFEDVNLRAMQSIAKAFNVNIGYSDHSRGIVVPIASVALGAVLIERHFTLDRAMSGPHHAASLEPNELKAMVQSIRNIEKAMGDGIKRPSTTELKNKTIARRRLVAA